MSWSAVYYAGKGLSSSQRRFGSVRTAVRSPFGDDGLFQRDVVLVVSRVTQRVIGYPTSEKLLEAPIGNPFILCRSFMLRRRLIRTQDRKDGVAVELAHIGG